MTAYPRYPLLGHSRDYGTKNYCWRYHIQLASTNGQAARSGEKRLLVCICQEAGQNHPIKAKRGADVMCAKELMLRTSLSPPTFKLKELEPSLSTRDGERYPPLYIEDFRSS
jgi:hypothetical protein